MSCTLGRAITSESAALQVNVVAEERRRLLDGQQAFHADGIELALVEGNELKVSALHKLLKW